MSASFSKFMKCEIRDEEFKLMGLPRRRKVCARRVQNPQELLDANREGGPFTSVAIIPIEPCFAMQTDMLIPSCPHLANLVQTRPHKHDKLVILCVRLTSTMMWSPWERMETMVKVEIINSWVNRYPKLFFTPPYAHHNIKRATRIEPKTSHLAERTSERSSEPPAPDCDRDPWYPFRALIDYEISKFAVDTGT
ncbi:hypothetical protein M404DRAFT_36437 [Pisolithus tinctorius Marx 270]|uniref:Uncharacterized protein n=1 Tax=Pisolithus tinctorius Marx 270 TaxID=870435 RepID=A0A0C3MVV1_PISTI|nr:hypothetical protein M404DRAFT_36437 [Pisolithus tinctorius Marx 270]